MASFWWTGRFYLVVELRREGFAPAAYAAGLFISFCYVIFLYGDGTKYSQIYMVKVIDMNNAQYILWSPLWNKVNKFWESMHKLLTV